jgi:hypothetical protein
MKLSELEKLANETGYMGRADPEDILTLCATFREMLEALNNAQHGDMCNAHKGPLGQEWVEDDKCTCGRTEAIKKAEEML